MADLISRQAAVDAFRKELRIKDDGDILTQTVYDGIVDVLSSLPSAQPEQPSREYIEQLRWERDLAIQQLKELGYGLGEKPRTQPEQRKGKWLNESMDYAECSECGFYGITTNYCPQCGADMRGEP